MTAVTVDTRYEGVMAHEYVSLDISNGYTFVSKLSKPIGLTVCKSEDSDSIVNYTLSGRTFTFQDSVGSGVKIFCDIVGRL